MSTTARYGTWESPLSAAMLAGGMVRFGDLHADGDRLVWLEQRPSEGGRAVLIAREPDGQVHELAPADFNARTRVHEYGGAAFAVRDEVVVASEWSSQRLHRIADGQASPVSAAPATSAAVRWADGRISPDGRWLVVVRESHSAGAEAVNEIVAVDLFSHAGAGSGAAEVHVLATGHDFYAAPRLSLDGRRLAFLSWDHPDMPWDGARLHVADFSDGTAGEPTAVAGGDDTAVCSPLWAPDGRLLFSWDRDGFWNLHAWEPGGDPGGEPGGEPVRLTSLAADIGAPHWQFGSASFAALDDGTIACVVTEHGSDRLCLVDESGELEPVELPWTDLTHIVAFGGGVAMLVAGPETVDAVATWKPGSGAQVVTQTEIPALRDGDAPSPEAISYPTPDGDEAHAFLYRPSNAEVTGPDDARPPLIVFTHGGPTGHSTPTLKGAIAYWTTRGFAIIDVNYRGSSGYGRAYRDALREQWGIHDVTDAIAAARHLADAGEVDGDAMAIRGGSAGGFTTLAVLTSGEQVFAAGTNLFGVADLTGLAEDTHKFESRYLDRLVGPYPQMAARYRERSPINHVDRLATPILVLQGLEDEVVPPAQSEAIVAAAAERGIPHAYIAFEGEQHGFRRAENIVTAMEAELTFYGQVFGFTPAGDLPVLDLGGQPA